GSGGPLVVNGGRRTGHRQPSAANRQPLPIALSGSTLVARRAGTNVASALTAARPSGTATNVAVSVALTPNNMLDNTRLSSMAATAPVTSPAMTTPANSRATIVAMRLP